MTEEDILEFKAELDRDRVAEVLGNMFPGRKQVELTGPLIDVWRKGREAFEALVQVHAKRRGLSPFDSNSTVARVERALSRRTETARMVRYSGTQLALLSAGGWYVWLMDGAVLWCQRPHVSFDASGLLHSTIGPAVDSEFAQLYFLRGINVPGWVVRKPVTERIDKITNLDVRAVAIDCMIGWPRYIREKGLEPVDENDNAVEGTLEALYQGPDGGRLVVTCATGRVFALGVPHWLSTCGEAQTWLRGGTKMNVIART